MLFKEKNRRTVINRIDGTKTTYSEVNYIVFDIPTIDYHNELYGGLQEKQNLYDIDEFEDYLEKESIIKDKIYIRLLPGGKLKKYKVTLPTYIRHLIHHPENTNNNPFTRDDLNKSIKLLRDLRN
ncbi:MAG: hypothetical protein A2V66_14320 [Ignavibacteria bacterium RBG_13_36_8]|nr:MAG: hypothetical protein A2V66_14320 [Ignavibacteria bacterium RBG_13_36_8]